MKSHPFLGPAMLSYCRGGDEEHAGRGEQRFLEVYAKTTYPSRVNQGPKVTTSVLLKQACQTQSRCGLHWDFVCPWEARVGVAWSSWQIGWA